MRTIQYTATFQTQTYSYAETVTVTARDINAGARKAIAAALRGLPAGHEFVSLEFAEAGREAPAPIDAAGIDHNPDALAMLPPAARAAWLRSRS